MDQAADHGGGAPVALSQGRGQRDGATAAPPGRPPTDGFAVATLLTGIVPLIPVTLVLGVIALIRIARTGARGRGLAITGLVLAGLWAIAGAAAAAVLVSQHPPARPAALPRIFQLHTGQCLNSSLNGISGVQVLPCSQPHTGEVFGTFQVAGHRYPGSAALQREASRRVRHPAERLPEPADVRVVAHPVVRLPGPGGVGGGRAHGGLHGPQHGRPADRLGPRRARINQPEPPGPPGRGPGPAAPGPRPASAAARARRAGGQSCR